jgi:hypothetical protein
LIPDGSDAETQNHSLFTHKRVPRQVYILLLSLSFLQNSINSSKFLTVYS